MRLRAQIILTTILAMLAVTQVSAKEEANDWHDQMFATWSAHATQDGHQPLPDLGSSDFTIAAWVKTSSGGTIFSTSSKNGSWAERGSKSFFIRNGYPSLDSCMVAVHSAKTQIADNKWHHTAVTYRQKTKELNFYTDGKPDGTSNLAIEPNLPTHVARIGLTAPTFSGPNAFQGALDDIAIFDSTLSPEQIQKLITEDLRNLKPLSFWPLNGNTQDGTTNGNHGIATAPKFTPHATGSALQLDGKTSVEIPMTSDPLAGIWSRLQEEATSENDRKEIAWEQEDGIWTMSKNPTIPELARRYAKASNRIPALKEKALTQAKNIQTIEELRSLRTGTYQLSRQMDETKSQLALIKIEALQLAIEDLTLTYSAQYPNGEKYLQVLQDATNTDKLSAAIDNGDTQALKTARKVIAIAQTALLENPLLNFDSLLFIKRGENNLGLPMNYHGNSDLRPTGYDNEICTLSPFSPDGEIKTIYRPEAGRFVGDIDLHFDAKKMMLSMPAQSNRWRLWELGIDGENLTELPLINEPDVDNYDACYLPDENIIFSSTAPFIGVPCVTGASHVTNLYHYNRTTSAIRRLTFDQEHNWCPTVLANGRVLFLRWEYSDIPHYVARILFQMNPDGTNQKEYYGSNSYWPNAMFYARPTPGNSSRFVAIIGGHHDVPRMGELVLFDLAQGRHEADGVVQRIPERGKKVEPIILDGLVGNSWPKFLHPYPLSDKYFIVSCKPSPEARWGIYLSDVFDNLTLIKEIDDYALLEPLPIRSAVRPPVVPDRTDPSRKDALVYMSDVYMGEGLPGVPRGAIKQLRVFTYHFSYHGMGGQVNRIGLDGPWDIKRIMGTVPVEPDGSALFRIPANTPISVQPLDEEGKAIQLMRSWFTAMPGETLSCVGCHERQNSSAPARRAMASVRKPSEITPWYGPTRGFSFKREVQPVLDRHCVECHNGEPRQDNLALPDFTARPPIHPPAPSASYANGSQFSPSYLALRTYVRSHTMESDMHILTPGEFHADTTELVQMLREGHHDVALDHESWDRIITWIDLNTPAHGTWTEVVGAQKVDHQLQRRKDMLKLYGDIDEDPESIIDTKPLASLTPLTARTSTEASASPTELSPLASPPAPTLPPSLQTKEIKITDQVTLRLVSIPAGHVDIKTGSAAKRIKIDNPFWMGAFEVTNEQFALFNPNHDSRLESGDFLQFSIAERGYPVNGPKQPVARVSWNQAVEFCQFLSSKTGMTFSLPTEMQWEYACRAGAATPLWYGELATDFSPYANLADTWLHAVENLPPWSLPSGAVHPWRPAIESVNDNYHVSAPVGTYQPNTWGLYDMHGNVAEWTLSPAPTQDNDGEIRNTFAPQGSRIVCGGSWYDRPKRATADFRLAYPPWRQVFNVGFRVACE